MARKKSRTTERSGGVDISGERVNVGGDIVGRDKITGKVVIHVGTLVVPAAPALIATLLATVALIAVAVSLRGLAPTPGPAKMQGAFNVAIAEFGEVDAEGQVQPSEQGRLLSQWVYESLQAQKDQFPDANIKSIISIWHDSLPVTEKSTTLGVITTYTQALRLAETINADLVIYGSLNNRAEFNPEFYVSPRLRGEIDASAGRYRLGDEPIRVDPSSRLSVSADLTTRTSGLFWVMMGLTYDLFGRSQQALDVFRQAEAELDNWQGKSAGKDIFYFFMGRAALFLSQQKTDAQDIASLEQEAQEAFGQALAINPDYARAHIGLGSLYFARAQRVPPDQRLAMPELAQTIAEYETALSLASQSPAEIEILATLALGTAHRLEGEALLHAGQYAEADRAYDMAIEQIQASLDHLTDTKQFRLIGQAYLALGTAYFQKAETGVRQDDTTGSRALFEEARRAFAQCIAQEDLARAAGVGEDKILTQTIIAEKCVPNERNAEEALSNAGGQ